MALSEPADTLTPDAADVSDSAVAGIAPVEAARRLGVTRSRIYALVQQGELDDSGGAWAILALASTDAAFRAHVAGRRSPWEQSRGWLRLKDRRLLDAAPRLRQGGVARRYLVDAESLLAVLEDARGVLAGTSAARQLGWHLPDGDCPVELYVPEAGLVDVIEAYALEMAGDEPVDVELRAMPDPGHSRHACAWCPRSSPHSTWPSRSPLLSPSWAAGGY